MYKIVANPGRYSDTAVDVRGPEGAVLNGEWWEYLNREYELGKLKRFSGHLISPEETPTAGKSILALCDQCFAEGEGEWIFSLRDFPTECEWYGEIRVYPSGAVWIHVSVTPWRASARLSGHEVV